MLIRTYTIAFFLPILMYAMPLHAIHAGQLNQNHDYGFWLEQNSNVELAKKWIFTLHFEERWGDKGKRLWFFEHWETLLYNFTENFKNALNPPLSNFFQSFTAGPGFAQAWVLHRNSEHGFRWSQANRVNLNAHVAMNWQGWLLKQRLVGEYWAYVTPQHPPSYAYYRHRVTLSNTIWKFTPYKISPFISNEWFFRAEKYKKMQGVETLVYVGGYYENRFRIGIGMEATSQISTQLWWQAKSNKQLPQNKPRWHTTYQIGFTIDLALK